MSKKMVQVCNTINDNSGVSNMAIRKKNFTKKNGISGPAVFETNNYRGSEPMILYGSYPIESF